MRIQQMILDDELDSTMMGNDSTMMGNDAKMMKIQQCMLVPCKVQGKLNDKCLNVA
jgi:hypothetical protein